MAFRRFFAATFLLLLFSSAAFAMSLPQAEAALKTKNKTEIFRAYDAFKSIYMDAAMKGDDLKKQRALKGIIRSGELLHIDVGAYRQKLASPAPSTSKPMVPKIVPKVSEKQKSKPAPVVRGRNRLSEVRWEEGRLVLQFDKPLGEKDVNYFKLKKTKTKGYRYVFDLRAVMDRSHTLTHRDLKRISLSQYNSETTRLVLESSRALPVHLSKNGQLLVISAGLGGVTSPKRVPPPVAAAHLKKRIVVIDPGHGGKDGGAVGYHRYKEKDIVLALASKTAALLRARGYTVYMTRTGDRFVKLRNRTRFANDKQADLFISIHANAVPRGKQDKAYGIETYFLSPSRSKRAANAAATENRAEVEDMDFYGKNTFLNALNSEKIVASHKLAIDLQAGVLSSLRARYKNVKDAGVREGPFWVLVGAQMPAVLVEVGFITHPTEATRLHSKTYQSYFARGLADGVEQYFAKNP